jgi:hypothetical protein
MDAAFRQLERVADVCDEPLYQTPAGRGLPLNDFCTAISPPATDGPCAGVPGSVAGWIRHARTSGIAARVAGATERRERLALLCAPRYVTEAFDGVTTTSTRITELRTELESLSRVARAFRVEVDEYADWVARRNANGRRGTVVAELRLGDLGELVRRLTTIGAAFEALSEAAHQGDIWAIVRLAPRQDTWLRVFDTFGRSAKAMSRVLTLISLVDVEGLARAEGETVGAVVDTLRTLGRPILARLGPVLAFMKTDRQMTIETMLYLLDQMNPEDIVVALGIAPEVRAFCDEEEGSLACWVHRILLVLGEATDVSEDQVSVDPNRIVKTLGALGEDYRRRNDWRWYFHLTIGLGGMVSSLPPAVSPTGAREVRFAPMMAEQIGLGYASPTFADGRFAFKLGIYGSGLLYRVVLDSEESEAFFFGAFVALELYQLLEIFAAPAAIIYPPQAGGDAHVSWALTFGAQVPLGDYLSQL